MAIAPTGAIYKALSFDNVSSRNYGVYITGEAVYNAPEREVEMISIPGRNGAFALDKGRFENIEVTYPAGIFADSETDFAEAISDFRNMLCSKRGYVRLQDEYNPNEYRMAIYKSGLEVDPAMLRAGEFEITFDCKPQRWLTSGETAVSVVSGNTLTNPTRFESSPLLEVEGYGTIDLGIYEIEVQDGAYGDVIIANSERISSSSLPTAEIDLGDDSMYNAGDPIRFSCNMTVNVERIPESTNTREIDAVAGTNLTATRTSKTTLTFYMDKSFSFVAGTSSVDTWQGLLRVNYSEGVFPDVLSGRIDYDVGVTATYDASLDKISITSSWNINSSSPTQTAKMRVVGSEFYHGEVIVESSATYLGDPTIIDCDLGIAYKVESGEIIDLNSYIDLGSDLPVLSSGANEVTYDNTITSLEIVPRWWKI